MKTYSQFIDEALLPSLIKAAARQFVKSKALQKAIPKVGKEVTKTIKLPSKVTGFQTGRGSKYTYTQKPQSWPQTQRTAAKDPYHPTAPGVKQKSDYTMFTTPDASMTMRDRFVSGSKEPFYKGLPQSTTPKRGRAPVEVWNQYAEKGNREVIHPGSPITDIQTTTRGSNVGLYGAQRKELKDRVKTGLQRPANIQALKKELGIKEDLIQEGRKKELRRAFDQGLRDGRPEIVTKAPPESSAPTAPGSPERDAQIKSEILGQSGGGMVVKAQNDKNKAFKKRRKEAIERIANKSKPKLNVTKVDAKKTFREFLEEAKRMRVLRTAHYTSRSNKSEIMRGGFKDSPSTGSYHPDNRKDIVYTTPSSRVGTDYGYSRVNLRLVNPKVTSTDSPRDFGKNIKSWMASSSIDDINDKKGKPTSSVDQAKAAFQKGDKVVRVPNAHGGFTPREGQVQGSYIMIDKDTANKSIDRNPQPTIRAKGKERRTKTQPKKDT
jgi:hypothetical protein